MKLKKVLLVTVLGMIPWLFPCISSAAENAFTTEKVFEGEVIPTITSVLKYGFNDVHRGILDYAARPGTIFKPACYDAKGNVIRDGDVLLHMDSAYRVASYEKAKADLEASMAKYRDTEQIYERNARLVKSHSISEVAYMSSKMEYQKAKANVESAKHSLTLTKQMLDICTFKAPFEGIVDQVFVCAGLMCGEQPAIQLSQLVPIGIKVKMDRRISSQITMSTPVKVYPLNSDTSVGIFNDGTYYPVNASGVYTRDEVIFTVDNYQLSPPVSLEDNGKKIPIFSTYWPVFDYKNKPDADSNIAVVSICIYNDSDGDYVWKLKGNKYLHSGRGVDYISPLQKVYIKKGDFSQYEASYAKVITVQPNKELEAGDILLFGSIPNYLKAGDKVCISNNRYLFMPGDPVRVVIGPVQNK